MKPLPKRLLIAGTVLFFCAPMVGLFFTVIGMIGAFKTLGENGIADPSILSAHVGMTLMATMAGMAVGGIGLLLVVAAAILHYCTKSVPPAPIR